MQRGERRVDEEGEGEEEGRRNDGTQWWRVEPRRVDEEEEEGRRNDRTQWRRVEPRKRVDGEEGEGGRVDKEVDEGR